MIPILLTATVNPKGMVGANFDPEERAQMYCEAMNFYLGKGLNVVIAENSGAAESFKFQVPSSKFQVPSSKVQDQSSKIKVQGSKFNDQALEILDVSGDEYDQSRGKGYNETILIHKAILKSKLIQEAGCFFKITGRLKVLNIDKLIEEAEKFQVSSFKFQVPNAISSKIKDQGSKLSFLADCKDHNIYEFLHMPINGHMGECRYWFASVDFFEQNMYPRYDELNDYDTPEKKKFLAEDLMLDICRKFRNTAGCRDRFRTQARISGRGGHNLGKGWSFFYSTDNDSLALKTKCAIRQMLRWIVPGVRI